MLLPMLTLAAFAAGAPKVDVVAVGGKPESVLAYGDDLFASNLGAVQAPAKDGDGYISRFTKDGVMREEKFVPLYGEEALDSPTGLAVVNDVLYVADLDRVIGYSIATRTRVFEAKVPSADVHFLNDLVYAGSLRLAVSATDAERLYLLDLRTRQWQRLDTGTAPALAHVNGLAWDDDRNLLFVAQNAAQTLQDANGRLAAFALGATDQAARFLWEVPFGRFLDGITLLGERTVLVSDWHDFTGGGVVHVVDATPAGGTLVRSEHWGQRGLADFTYDPWNDLLALPAMMQGEVHIVHNPYPAQTTLACVPRNDWSNIGAATLGINEFGAPRWLAIGDVNLAVTGYSSSNDTIWSKAYAPGLNVTVAQTRGSQAYGLEIEYPREPDTDCPNPRLCNPSASAWAFYICR